MLTFKSAFDVETAFGNYTITGNVLGFDYHIAKNGKEIGHSSRHLSLRDSFALDINDNEDYMFVIALVIAIDNITDRMNQDRSSTN